MFHFLFLGFLLLPAPLYAQVSLEQALDTLVAAPWTKSPAALPDSKSWTIEQYTIHDTGELQGYDLRAFERNIDSLILKLFTYSEPSLTSSSEIILMGFVQGISPTEEGAKPLLEKMTAYMKSRGFVDSAPDSITKQMATWRLIQSCTFLKKGELSCAIFLKKDDRNNRWLIRTMVFHPLFQEFRNKWMAEWPKYWDSQYIMPEKLIRELENRKISQIFSPALWEKINSISLSLKSPPPRKVNTIPVNELITAYETIDKTTVPENDRPAFLLLKNYLARYLFICGLGKEITPEQKKWLESYGLEYTWSELGMTFSYGETVLQKLIDGNPNSYWGQFAFLELLERGFDTSGMCREGQDQWRKVLEEGFTFLKKYPGSEFAPDIKFYMGQAEETLFNLGIIKDHPARDTYRLSMSSYADKSEDARKQAIGYYDEVLRSPQKGLYENYLKYILPRLRAGFATGTDYYFCFYD
ncbi:MAG: hypothetical protein Q8O92_11055 [Candidatus Latescibacter sp.]|nr:hypothetical protein [Candidatus Latescibacter sp.]